MATVTVNLGTYSFDGVTVTWLGGGASFGDTFSASGSAQTLHQFTLTRSGTNAGRVILSIIDFIDDFTLAFEAVGRIIATASDGETLEVRIANADTGEPYTWVPANSAEVIAFVDHVSGLSDTTATLTLTDEDLGLTSVTFNMSGFFDNSLGFVMGWGGEISLGTTFSVDGSDQMMTDLGLFYGGDFPGHMNVNTSVDFTDSFEAIGAITFTASDGEQLTIYIANEDMDETYVWTPENSAEVVTFANHARGLADTSATITLTGDAASPPDTPAAPTFTNVTSIRATVNWIEPEDNGADITSYDVQVRQGTSGTYSTVTDQTGLTYSLTGLTPSSVYQVRVRATNSEGDSDYSDNGQFTTRDAHVANAGDISFAFAIPQADISRSRTRNAGDISFAFAVPQADISRSRTRNAAASSFSVAVPDAAVTYERGPRAHTINAGDATWSFTSPNPTLRINPTFQVITIEAARLFRDTATEKRWDFNGDDAVLLDDFLFAGVGVAYLRRIRVVQQSNGLQFVIGLAPTSTIAIGFSIDNLVEEWEVNPSALGFVQGTNGVASIPGPDHPDNVVRDIVEIYNWRIPPDTAAYDAALQFFFTDADTSADLTVTFRTSTPATEFTIDAGGASFEFDTSAEPTVVLASSHMVDASDVSFVFTLSEPTIARSRARNAGAATFSFTSSQPSVTSGGLMTVDAGDAAFLFVISEPDTTVARRIDAGGVAWAFAIPPPTTLLARAVDAGNVSFTFVVSEPSTTSVTEHGVNAGDAAWDFATPQVGVSRNRQRDSGDASFVFAIPESITTRTRQREAGDAAFAFDTSTEPVVTLSHSYVINAGDVSWLVNVPQASGTHIGVMGTSHAVSAGVTNFAYTAPQPAITKLDALLLTDPRLPTAGRQFDMRALIRAAAPNDLFQQSPNPARGELLEGNVAVGPDDSALTRIRNAGGGSRIVLREDDADFSSSTYFRDGGDGHDLTLTLITQEGVFDLTIADNIDTSAGTNTTQVRVDIPVANQAVINSIRENDRFIIALWRSVSARIVDAGDVDWDVDTSTEPTVSRGRARDAGDASWAFSIPESTVLRSRMRDVSAVDWTFAVPQVSADHNREHEISANAASWAFTLSEPTVTLTSSHGANPGDAAWVFILPELLVTRSRARDADVVSWAFTTPQVSADHNQEHEISASPVQFVFAVPQPTTVSGLVADAGDAEWVFAVLEPVVTLTARVDSHEVVADAAEWSFTVLTLGITKITSHEIDAGNANFAITIPEPQVVSGTPVFSRFNLGPQPFGPANDTPWEGAIGINPGLLEGGGPAFLRYFSPELGDFGTTIFLRIAATPSASPTASGPQFMSAVELSEFTLSEVGGSSISFRGPNDPANAFSDPTEPYEWRLSFSDTVIKTWLQGIGTGDIILDVGPFRADAGDAAWSVIAATPTITHLQAHEVNAGIATWTFIIDSGESLSAAAGDANWLFTLPEPTTFHSRANAVNAGDASWLFTIPQASGNRRQSTDANDAEWRITTSIPSVLHFVDVFWVLSVATNNRALNTVAGTVNAREHDLDFPPIAGIAIHASSGLTELAYPDGDGWSWASLTEGIPSLSSDGALYVIDIDAEKYVCVEAVQPSPAILQADRLAYHLANGHATDNARYWHYYLSATLSEDFMGTPTELPSAREEDVRQFLRDLRNSTQVVIIFSEQHTFKPYP